MDHGERRGLSPPSYFGRTGGAGGLDWTGGRGVSAHGGLGARRQPRVSQPLSESTCVVTSTSVVLSDSGSLISFISKTGLNTLLNLRSSNCCNTFSRAPSLSTPGLN